MCFCNNFPSKMFSSVQKWKVWWRVLWKTEFSLWSFVRSMLKKICCQACLYFSIKCSDILLITKLIFWERHWQLSQTFQSNNNGGEAMDAVLRHGLLKGPQLGCIESLHSQRMERKEEGRGLLKTGFDWVFFAQMTFGSFTKSSHHASPLMLLASLIMASTF